MIIWILFIRVSAVCTEPLRVASKGRLPVMVSAMGSIADEAAWDAPVISD